MSWNEDLQHPSLHITTSFVLQNDKEKIKLPHSVVGMNDLYLVIKNLKANCGNLEPQSDQWIYTVEGKVGINCKLDYDVIQDFEGDPSLNERYYRPLISPSGYQVFGESLFVLPDWNSEIKRNIQITYRFPKTFKLVDSFGEGISQRKIQTSLSLLKQSTFVGGKDILIKHFNIHSNPIEMAFLGPIPESDSYLKILKSVLKTERSFWNDENFPYYFVSAVYVGGEGGGGQGRTNGFSIFVGGHYDRLWTTHLLSHELFHTWNGHTILKQEPEEKIYWFSEGFTDFYANRLSLRGGLFSSQEYLNEINKMIQKYLSSKIKNTPLDILADHYWSNSTLEKLPYQQGQLLALIWDAELRNKKSPHSLDEGMRNLLKGARSKGMVSSNETIIATMTPILGRDVTADVKKWIVDATTIDQFPSRIGKCVERVDEKIARFDLGFDKTKSKQSGYMTEVSPNGPAYAAGIRNGDRMRGWSIHQGDVKHTVQIEIERDGQQQTISFLPQNGFDVMPQYKISAICLKDKSAGQDL